MPSRSRRAILRGVAALSVGLAGCQDQPTGTPLSEPSPTDSETETATETPSETPTESPRATRQDRACDDQWNPRERWRFPTGIRAYGPAVADGVVYFGAQGDRFHALDADSGAVRWQRDQPAPHSSRPAVHAGTVVVPGYEAVSAHDAASGDTEWTFALPGDYAEVTSDPAVGDGRVVVTATNHAGTMQEPPDTPYRRLYAVDLADGTEAWHRDFQRSDSLAGLATLGDRVVVAADDGEVIAFDGATGDDVWTTSVASSGLVDGPAVAGDTAFVQAAGRLAAVERTDGTVRWRRDGGYEGDPAVGGDAVYCRSGDELVAQERSDGRVRWRAVIPAEGRRLTATEDAAYVTVSGDDGAAMVGVDAGSGCRLGRYEFAARDVSGAAADGDTLYVGGFRDDGAMYAVSRPGRRDT